MQIDPKKVTSKDKTVIIKAKVKAIRSTSQIVLGFSITDSSGANLFGTNMQIKNMNALKMKKGEVKTVCWKVPNIFSDGTQYVNVAAVDSSGTTTYDWWDEALRFSVRSEEKTPYPVNPEVDVEIKNT